MIAYFSDNYVNTNLASAIITGGPAAALAVLVNDTNLADARWIPFSAFLMFCWEQTMGAIKWNLDLSVPMGKPIGFQILLL
jgi:hypothetical protein